MGIYIGTAGMLETHEILMTLLPPLFLVWMSTFIVTSTSTIDPSSRLGILTTTSVANLDAP